MRIAFVRLVLHKMDRQTRLRRATIDSRGQEKERFGEIPRPYSLRKHLNPKKENAEKVGTNPEVQGFAAAKP